MMIAQVLNVFVRKYCVGSYKNSTTYRVSIEYIMFSLQLFIIIFINAIRTYKVMMIFILRARLIDELV